MPSYDESSSTSSGGSGSGDDIMTAHPDYLFVRALKKDLRKRTIQDLQIIYSNLRTMEALSSMREPSLRSLCKAVRYERHEANDILYCRGELSTCWYVLLSGSVFIDGCMFLPRASFGKRSGASGRRLKDCLILEPSEMLVIDYPDTKPIRPLPRQSVNTINLDRLMAMEQEEVTRRKLPSTNPPPSPPLSSLGAASHGAGGSVSVVHGLPGSHGGRSVEQYPGEFMMSMSGRVRAESDTSSAYSGSDTMGSSAQTCSSENDDLDYTDPVLVETNVDSDDEEEEEDIDNIDCCRDTVRDCLEKDPADRTDVDIEILLEFTQQLKAFSNMTMAVRRALCAAMVFAVVEKAGTIVMNDGEELDSWSVIVNGVVEINMSDGSKLELGLGDSFGITPTMEKMYHVGVMRTKVDDCQFACITQTDYYRILHQGEENTLRHTEGDRTVLVTEQRAVEGGNRRGQVIIRGTIERLMAQLVEDNSEIDPTYVEDFLLTHRTFIESPVDVANQLLEWFSDPKLRDRVTRVVLLWVNNHFTDFEMDPDMMTFLEQFEAALERQPMTGQMRLLHIACAAKARTRTITLPRSNRSESLQFTLISGTEVGCGIFISKVDKGSKAEQVGLKRGDQILEVNGRSFERLTLAKATELLSERTLLAVTVKSNLLAFKEMLNATESAEKGRGRKGSDASVDHTHAHRLGSDSSQHSNGSSTLFGNFSLETMVASPPRDKMKETQNKGGFMTLGHRSAKIMRALERITKIPKFSGDNPPGGGSSDDSVHSSISSSGRGNSYMSRSNPDLPSLSLDESLAGAVQGCTLSNPGRNEHPEHVLKVYKADQSCKYLLINKETTARQVVMLASREFGLLDGSTKSADYSLWEVSASHGTCIKQRKLPDQLQNLAERMGLSSRYYLKNNNVTDPLIPDEMAPELARESQVSLLALRAVEVATQLTLQDFSIFRQIEATEYVDDLFDNKKSRYGLPLLSKFSELVNTEMFWVVSEIVSEHNLVKRARLIKQFIKIARQCKECRNFNSMFAILSGLGHGAVARLKNSWDRVPQKYMNLFNDMQALMDPSRNMAKYRNLLASDNAHPQAIPFWPVVKKDLTFIHLGNDTIVDGLYNFEKLRMIAKEVRSLINMCSAPYDLQIMVELGPAMLTMNQMTTGGHSSLATLKKRKKSVATPNPKKMFEEAQMVRRVKAYLSNLKVNTDEDALRQMSLECEGGGNLSGGGGGSSTAVGAGSATLRRRQPSPTLSTASSNSQTSTQSDQRKPKFGAASPQSVRKLLALSEPKTRPYQPPKPLPSGSTHSLSPCHSPAASRKASAVSLSLHGHSLSTSHFTRNNSHERSHSDTPSLVPVDLTIESTSVTSLNNLPFRKSQHSSSSFGSSSEGGFHQTDGSLQETDSGHGDSQSNSSNEIPGPSHVTAQMGATVDVCRPVIAAAHWHHSPPPPPPPQRRFSAHPASSASSLHYHRPPFPAAVPVLPPIPGRSGMMAAPSIRPRRPPEYTPPPVFRQPQAHPRSMVNRTRSHDSIDPVCSRYIDADDEGAQVSAV